VPILGIFTGLAAFFGAFMNMNYLLPGTVSTNPILLVFAVLLMLAWKTAGWGAWTAGYCRPWVRYGGQGLSSITGVKKASGQR
jgi:hypothetical protein